MRQFLRILAVLCISLPGISQTNHCLDALPKDGNGAVYDRLRASSYTDLHYLLDEFVYQMNFSTHDEALHAGLNVGAIVYGVPLKVGGIFDKSTKDQWRNEYESRRKTQFAQTTLSTLAVDKLNPSVISIIASGCMDFGLFSVLRPTDDCHFKFRAGYRSDKLGGDRITPARLAVTGGQCDAWPEKRLPPGGDEITCTRSGKGAVTVVLTTKEVGSTSQTLPPLDPPTLPLEPQVIDQLSEPIIQDIDVNGWQSVKIGGDRACPDCKDLFANDFAPDLSLYPNNKGALITAVNLIGRSGTCSHWILCPDGGNCGVDEFTSPTNSSLSCIGQPNCRMHHITNGSRACTEKVHLTFSYRKQICQNCDGQDYATAHAAWLTQKQKAEAYSCPQVTDKPAQVLSQR